MSELTLLNESTVEPEQIDSLGHMNVRYYMMRVDVANRLLLEQAGITAGPGQAIRRLDTYTRFHREQFAGARLHTLGGFVDDGTAYFEIRNPDNDQVAASFVLRSAVVDVVSQEVVVPAAGLDIGAAVSVPDYGLPRSLSLDPPSQIPLEALEGVGLDEATPGMMSGRRENIVHSEDCDENGRLREDVDLMFVLHRPAPGQKLDQMGPPMLRDSEGRRFSWAMMETRSVVWHRPMAGQTLLSIGADVANGEKWRQSRRWMFTKETGLLLGISDSVGLCMDLDARRSIPMPQQIRESVERNLLSHLA